MVGDHRREPAHLVARGGQVVGDVARRADDALERRRVAARLLGRLAGGAHRPLDDVRVGELDDHAVAVAPGDGEHASARSRRRASRSRAGPCAPTRARSRCRSTRTFSPFMNGLIICRVSSKRATGTGFWPMTRRAESPRPMPMIMRPLGDVLQRRVRARDDRRLARARVRDHVAELDASRSPARPARASGTSPATARASRRSSRTRSRAARRAANSSIEALVRRVGEDGDAEAQAHTGITSSPRA